MVWLDTNGKKYTFRDIKKENPTKQELADWHAKSGVPLRKFFNTSGTLYKSMELSKKIPEMSEEAQLDLLATDGMLIKRPLVVTRDVVLVGFKKQEWEAKLG